MIESSKYAVFMAVPFELKIGNTEYIIWVERAYGGAVVGPDGRERRVGAVARAPLEQQVRLQRGRGQRRNAGAEASAH